MFARLGTIIVDQPRRVILLVAVFAAVLLAGLQHTRFVSDFDSTLPNRSPLTQQILENQNRFGGRNSLVFLVKGGTEPARMASACALTARLLTLPGIAQGRVYGVGSNSLKFVRPVGDDLEVTGLAALCSEGQRLTPDILAGLGPQRPLVQAPDRSLILAADVTVVSGAYQPLLDRIDQAIAQSQVGAVTIAYSGQPAFLAQNDRFSKRIALFFPVIMALVLLLHWEALRNWQAVVVPIFTGLMATLMGLGIYGWLRQPLDTYTVLAPVLILAVGAGHSVQLLKRYMEEVRLRTPLGVQVSVEDNKAAIVRTLSAMGPVLTIAVLGASACLFALLLLDVSALARFGLLAGVGVISALVLELTVVPAIRALLRRPVIKPGYGDLSRWWQRGLERLGELALTGPARPIGVALLLLAAALAAGVWHVKASYSMAEYTAADVPVQRTLTSLAAAGVGPYVLDVVIDTGRPDGAFDPKVLSAMITLQQRLEQDPDVRAVLSPAAVMGFLNCQFAQSGRCTVQAPARPEEAQQIWTVLFGGGREAAMLDEQARHTRLRAFVQTDRAQDTQRLITIIDRLAAEQGLAVSLGGSAVTAKALADGIVRVSLEKAALLVAIVILIGGIVFRSVKMALLFAIPSVLTIAANFAYLGWSGTTLNVATAAVATIAVGVGLDYLIYLTFRIREAQRRGALYVQSIREGLASAGGAAVCVASAVAIGYAVLIFSPGYLVHHWIAALVPMTMIMSLFGALFVFPYLVRLARPSFEGRVDLMDHVDADLAHYFGNTRIS